MLNIISIAMKIIQAKAFIDEFKNYIIKNTTEDFRKMLTDHLQAFAEKTKTKYDDDIVNFIRNWLSE